MHELSIVQGIIGIIEKEWRAHNFSKVESVEVICGEYNCLCESNLQFCFDAVAAFPYMQGARLRIKRIAGGNAVYIHSLEVR